MNIKRKIELALAAISSIAQHDDADFAVRDAALKKVEGYIETERAEASRRVQDAVNETCTEAGGV